MTAWIFGKWPQAFSCLSLTKLRTFTPPHSNGIQTLQHSGPYPARISNLSIFSFKDGSQNESGVFRARDLTGADGGGTLSFWSSPLASEHRGCTSYFRSSITTMLNMELTVNYNLQVSSPAPAQTTIISFSCHPVPAKRIFSKDNPGMTLDISFFKLLSTLVSGILWILVGYITSSFLFLDLPWISELCENSFKSRICGGWWLPLPSLMS